ncbi:hypothetical protein M8J77_015338 [Diaphorina citri]|nr:hypothetical protein M8J77_007801 [Diaphorina citri]KAI5718044.1 hypothetical protein M8J77_015338 [Diaphorina citri]
MSDTAKVTYSHLMQVPLKYLNIVGVLNNVPQKSEFRRVLAQMNFIFVHVVCWVSSVNHFMATVTRSVRYMPEFFQRLLEDLTINLFLGTSLICCYHNEHVQFIIKFMENYFSVADEQVIKACNRSTKILLIVFTTFGTVVFTLPVFETFLPISEQEKDLIACIYKRSHPERRFAVNLWVPFIDDSESWYYECIFMFEIYQIYLLLMVAVPATTIIPMFITYTEGQYVILSDFVEKIGQTHTDKIGRRIFYTSLRKGEWVYVSSLVSKRNKKQQLKRLLESYEKEYCRQVIKFHHMLLKFQYELHILYTRFMSGAHTLNNLMLAICMYQLLANPQSLSVTRLVKFILDIAAVLTEFYYLCYCSERLDECNARLRRAVVNCDWHRCSNDTRLALCMFLRKVQEKNHLHFFHGLVFFSNELFLKVIKVSYSFVNFMRLNSS